MFDLSKKIEINKTLQILPEKTINRSRCSFNLRFLLLCVRRCNTSVIYHGGLKNPSFFRNKKMGQSVATGTEFNLLQ